MAPDVLPCYFIYSLPTPVTGICCSCQDAWHGKKLMKSGAGEETGMEKNIQRRVISVLLGIEYLMRLPVQKKNQLHFFQPIKVL